MFSVMSVSLFRSPMPVMPNGLSEITWDPQDILKLVHLETSPTSSGPTPLATWGPPDMFKLVYYVAHTSDGKSVTSIRMKCLLVL